MDEIFSFLLITVISSHSDSESPAADSIRGRIIRQQADKLVRMNILGDLAHEHQEEDRRVRDEDARHVIDAEEAARAAEARPHKRPQKRPNERPENSIVRRAHLERKRLEYKLMAQGLWQCQQWKPMRGWSSLRLLANGASFD